MQRDVKGLLWRIDEPGAFMSRAPLTFLAVPNLVSLFGLATLLTGCRTETDTGASDDDLAELVARLDSQDAANAAQELIIADLKATIADLEYTNAVQDKSLSDLEELVGEVDLTVLMAQVDSHTEDLAVVAADFGALDARLATVEVCGLY